MDDQSNPQMNKSNDEQSKQEFVDIVVRWLKLDDKIRLTMEKLKEYRDEKKQYEDTILSAMGQMDENVITISSGKLRRNTSKTKGALKHEQGQT